MEQIKVSVILTSFNKSGFIGRAIESVLNQSYKNIELIIVDDGSKDNSREVINSYAQKDSRVKPFFFEKNRGIPSAHNFGIKMAQGKYCAMIDCDDFWESDKLEKQLKILEENTEYGACFTWIRVVDEEEKIVSSEECENRDIMWNSENHTQGEWLYIFFTEGCKLGNPSMLVRKEILDKVGYYSYGLKQLQDYDLFIRILKECNVYVIPEKLVNYRWFRGEIKNTSFDNIETASRSNFEYYLICKNFFSNMDSGVFKQGFKECITNECSTKVEEVYEQTMITLERYLVPVVGRAAGLENIYLLLNNESFRNIIEEKYSMTSTVFAEQLKETIFFDEKYYMPKNKEKYENQLEEKINDVTKEWYRENEYNKELICSLKQTEEYKSNLEDTSREQSSIIENQSEYINELEQKVRETSDLYLKCNEYAKELEQKVRETSDLYLKCNEYAMKLEERIRLSDI